MCHSRGHCRRRELRSSSSCCHLPFIHFFSLPFDSPRSLPHVIAVLSSVHVLGHLLLSPSHLVSTSSPPRLSFHSLSPSPTSKLASYCSSPPSSASVFASLLLQASTPATPTAPESSAPELILFSTWEYPGFATQGVLAPSQTCFN